MGPCEFTSIAFYIADVPMSSGTVEQGYARILAGHGNVVCTAQALDADHDPPTWSMDLPAYSKSVYGSMLPAILKNATP